MTALKRPDFNLWQSAASQHGVLTHAQFVGAGLTPAAIKHRTATGRLWRVHPGVFAVGRRELTREGAWLAAVLACGPSAVLSHETAAILWEILDDHHAADPHVSVLIRAGRSGPGGIHLHRPRALTDEDTTRRNHIPVTTLARTLRDLSHTLTERELERALREAEYRHGLDLAALRRTTQGHPRLRQVLDKWVPGIHLTESELEALFLRLCARAGLPRPETQVRLKPHRVDFLWRAQRLVVETDGYEAHRGRIAFRQDRVKDRALQATGLEVQHFTWAEVVGAPRSVAAEVGAAIRRRS